MPFKEHKKEEEEATFQSMHMGKKKTKKKRKTLVGGAKNRPLSYWSADTFAKERGLVTRLISNMAARNVSFAKPKTPSFIEKFKEKVGYKESATVETKFETPDSSNLDDTEHTDEKPTVVLGSNVSEAEADAFLARLRDEGEVEASAQGLKLIV